MKKTVSILLTLVMLLSLCACGAKEPAAAPVTQTELQSTTPQTEEAVSQTEEAVTHITVTDMIGREVTVVPGSYKKVVCIGAGALRMYSYIGDVALLAGVEDIDNTALSERPMMFDSVARPYILAFGDSFTALPSCGVGGPMAQTAEAEKILSCDPDIVISEFEDVEKSDALQDQLGVPVITLSTGSKGVFDERSSAPWRCWAPSSVRRRRPRPLSSMSRTSPPRSSPGPSRSARKRNPPSISAAWATGAPPTI